MMLSKLAIQTAQIFTLALLSLLLCSCGWEGDAIDTSFSAVVKPEPQPNHYVVHLQWEPTKNASAWVIQRKVKEASPKVIATVEPQIHSYVDSPVIAGETYSYYLGVLDGSQFKALRELKIEVSRDFVVDSSIVAHSIEGYNRLFFAPSGRLITYGGKTTISVNEILSSNGVIETFPETAHAPFGVAGRNGGELTIQAKTGQGTLHIIARGEGGGVGPQGARGKTGYTGREGFRGECRQVPRYHPERGSVTGYDNECWSQTGDGVPGGQGYDGNPGLPGMSGGDSARVSVRIEDPAGIQIKPQAIGGKGGLGGPGGPGGFGGIGGEPGPRLCNECRAAFHGGPGKPGNTGPVGLVGPSGSQQPICLRLGTATFGDCDKFQK